MFLPGDRHVRGSFPWSLVLIAFQQAIIGTKTGELEILDLNSSSLVESIKAHEGAIWSMDLRPDQKGIVTGSADKDVKFWEFQLLEDVETRVMFKFFPMMI